MEQLIALWNGIIWIGCYFTLSVVLILATFGIGLMIRFLHLYCYKSFPVYKRIIDA